MSQIIAQIETPTTNEVADAIRDLDETEPERYRVEWESETKAFQSTKYDVKAITFGAGGRMMMRIVGGRGGEYEIDSNVNSASPLLHYFPPKREKQTEKLTKLHIFDTEFKYEPGLRDRLGM